MAFTIKINGEQVNVLDKDCACRSCFWFFVDKGSYTPGRGYTSYYKKPRYCCGTRHMHGCPHPIPGTTEESKKAMAENVRCCPEPKFTLVKEGKRQPKKQKCLSCGEWAEGLALELRKTLPKQDGRCICKHIDVHKSDNQNWEQWYCGNCGQYFHKKPQKFELGEADYYKFLDVVFGKKENQ